MDEDRYIAKIAHMYYIENIDMKSIGEIFNVSYATISRLLKKGRENGIVKIMIDSPSNRTIGLEADLKGIFKLKEVFAVNAGTDVPYETILDRIGIETSNYLESILRNKDVLGISWGRTVYNVVNHFHSKNKINIDVIQLFGNTSNIPVELNSFDLVRRMKNMFSGSYYSINSEAALDNPETKRVLLEETSIKNTFFHHDKVNIALSGVGVFNPDSPSFVHKNYMWEEEVAEYKGLNVVGETNFTFFDINGNILKGKFNDRVVSITTENLLGIKNKIIVTGGIDKAPAILGAIRAKLVDILFIDSATLEKVLALSK